MSETCSVLYQINISFSASRWPSLYEVFWHLFVYDNRPRGDTLFYRNMKAHEIFMVKNALLESAYNYYSR